MGLFTLISASSLTSISASHACHWSGMPHWRKQGTASLLWVFCSFWCWGLNPEPMCVLSCWSPMFPVPSTSLLLPLSLHSKSWSLWNTFWFILTSPWALKALVPSPLPVFYFHPKPIPVNFSFCPWNDNVPTNQSLCLSILTYWAPAMHQACSRHLGHNTIPNRWKSFSFWILNSGGKSYLAFLLVLCLDPQANMKSRTFTNLLNSIIFSSCMVSLMINTTELNSKKSGRGGKGLWLTIWMERIVTSKRFITHMIFFCRKNKQFKKTY